ncbi:response regulator transcription factor [Paenibacillus dendritiformis]|uniref:Two component transcriptional regulator n=1 Tax=Paenibacillus dendritiformis C454 TaxID=1131935 RepID=H3SD57_9BACL|nr:response regulator transcription factor [Paenibacillus dendritiformis]EHQ62964.1 two component transcriptional regulator [Paenibacillus dendritiformis C454]PZM64440.1 DNA-binding response regulator [Paenibacillus dendritiformis]CAH8771668.1 response regulator transcription factor [Paenibacillus dendritiformis]
MYRIMIVEDDDKIASILQSSLEKYDYKVTRATDFKALKEELLAVNPDLILLDIHLPAYDGFYWCRQFRMVTNAPIIFVSARTGEMDQVMAIENGGDDFITKPFHLDVLLAKVKGVLRRTYGEYASTNGGEELVVHGLSLHRSRNTLEWKGSRVDLTKNEALLLAVLMERAGHIVSRETLLETLWDDVDFVDDNTLTVNVTRVRKKLEEIGIHKAIETMRGQGYRLQTSWTEDGDWA